MITMKSLRAHGWALRGAGLFVFVLLFAFGSFARAGEVGPGLENESCLKCHEDATFESTAHPETQCAECHANITAEHKGALPADQKLEADAICGACHGMAAKQMAKSVHAEQSCKKCHGPAHKVDKASEPDARLSALGQLKTCGKCHDDVMAGFEHSVHGKGLLKSGLTEAAPSCSDCHGSHAIVKHEEEKAKMGHMKSPEACGACHSTVLREWADESVHGALWKEGKDGPVCIDCHVKEHEVHDPTTAAEREAMPMQCGNCHEEDLHTFRDSFHGKATALGWSQSAMCSDCHTPHKNLPATDPRSSIHPDNLKATCGACHAKEVEVAGFMTFDPHVNPHDPATLPQLRFIYFFMTGLLLGVFAFFGIHLLLWLQRGLVGKLRGEFKTGHGGQGPYVKRFSRGQIWIHVSIVVSFLMLAVSGLPLKFATAPWADTMVKYLGGAYAAGIIHRIAAIITFGYFAVHIGMLAHAWFVKKERGFFWGWRSMVPQPRDVSDFIANMKYFLYLGPRPKFDRFTYWEKFDYLAVFWGVAMIGVSGLMLWFPDFFSKFLPGWALNAAYIIHSDEALLATGFIFLFHFFHTHLRPEAFPMDPVIFTGEMPLERFKEERPLEYERMVASGTLEKHLVPAPEQSNMTAGYVFGTIAVVIGLACAVAIFVALWGLFFG
jgi:cytochrome b subunit of formate dehydrogenase